MLRLFKKRTLLTTCLAANLLVLTLARSIRSGGVAFQAVSLSFLSLTFLPRAQ